MFFSNFIWTSFDLSYTESVNKDNENIELYNENCWNSSFILSIENELSKDYISSLESEISSWNSSSYTGSDSSSWAKISVFINTNYQYYCLQDMKCITIFLLANKS